MWKHPKRVGGKFKSDETEDDNYESDDGDHESDDDDDHEIDDSPGMNRNGCWCCKHTFENSFIDLIYIYKSVNDYYSIKAWRQTKENIIESQFIQGYRI